MLLTTRLHFGHCCSAFARRKPCCFGMLALLQNTVYRALLTTGTPIQMPDKAMPLLQRCSSDPRLLLLAQRFTIVAPQIVDALQICLCTLLAHTGLAKQCQCTLLALCKQICHALQRLRHEDRQMVRRKV